jgi:hypothetical protein
MVEVSNILTVFALLQIIAFFITVCHLKRKFHHMEKKQVKISEDKAAMDRQMKKIEEEKTTRDAEELARRRTEEQEAKRLEDEIQ